VNAAPSQSGHVLLGCSPLAFTWSQVPQLHHLRAGLHHRQPGPWGQKTGVHQGSDSRKHGVVPKADPALTASRNSTRKETREEHRLPCGSTKG